MAKQIVLFIQTLNMVSTKCKITNILFALRDQLGTWLSKV